MDKDEALKMAIEVLDGYAQPASPAWRKALNACKEALEQPVCNPHPKAPHGFKRDASHSADRYVCDCEGWDAWQEGYEEGLRAGLALEQPAQEPVCWWNETMGFDGFVFNRDDTLTPLYTHPHQWQGLTDDEIARLVLINEVDKSGDTGFVRLIEHALKEKNHG